MRMPLGWASNHDTFIYHGGRAAIKVTWLLEAMFSDQLVLRSLATPRACTCPVELILGERIPMSSNPPSGGTKCKSKRLVCRQSDYSCYCACVYVCVAREMVLGAEFYRLWQYLHCVRNSSYIFYRSFWKFKEVFFCHYLKLCTWLWHTPTIHLYIYSALFWTWLWFSLFGHKFRAPNFETVNIESILSEDEKTGVHKFSEFA